VTLDQLVELKADQPATRLVVVAMAGIILPAMPLDLSLSAGGIE